MNEYSINDLNDNDHVSKIIYNITLFF